MSKVPEVTVYFWIIKVLATTVGETAADLLNFNLGLGGTTIAMFVVLAVAMLLQYRPSVACLLAVVVLVGYLTVSRRDQIAAEDFSAPA
ncbi:hypothetical protein ACQP1P_28350 [Dactylosporangium sp. CA-052675]|uniref:hypothetical protein n=1 Tax=Dactylosporangium sp. CA-052675 TaxID=3239927 RepID=UPI003D8B5455